MEKGDKKGLLPLVFFIIMYFIAGIYMGGFKKIPIEVLFLVSSLFSLVLNKKHKFSKKVETFCKGGGNQNIILMSLIFILAGIFSQISKEVGSIDSVVNFGLSIFPNRVLLPAIFVISCFLSLSIGTSVGTIVALTPIAIGISDMTKIPLELCCAAVLGGAMFGDNLSIISDTTIVATKTQGCEMTDKFKTNLKLVIVPSLLTILLFYIKGNLSKEIFGFHELKYSIIEILPYIFVLGAAILGVDVFIVLILGIIFSSVIGFMKGQFNFIQLLKICSDSMKGSGKIIIIVILVGGMIGVVKENGGLAWLINKIRNKIKKKKDAEIGIGILTLLIDMCVGNNTIAVITTGPIAKEISSEYNLDSKEIASILDTCAAGIQGLLPYSNPMLAVLGIATEASVVSIIKYNYYSMLMLIVTFLVVHIKNSDYYLRLKNNIN